MQKTTGRKQLALRVAVAWKEISKKADEGEVDFVSATYFQCLSENKVTPKEDTEWCDSSSGSIRD